MIMTNEVRNFIAKSIRENIPGAFLQYSVPLYYYTKALPHRGVKNLKGVKIAL